MLDCVIEREREREILNVNMTAGMAPVARMQGMRIKNLKILSKSCSEHFREERKIMI